MCRKVRKKEEKLVFFLFSFPSLLWLKCFLRELTLSTPLRKNLRFSHLMTCFLCCFYNNKRNETHKTRKRAMDLFTMESCVEKEFDLFFYSANQSWGRSLLTKKAHNHCAHFVQNGHGNLKQKQKEKNMRRNLTVPVFSVFFSSFCNKETRKLTTNSLSRRPVRCDWLATACCRFFS